MRYGLQGGAGGRGNKKPNVHEIYSKEKNTQRKTGTEYHNDMLLFPISLYFSVCFHLPQ